MIKIILVMLLLGSTNVDYNFLDDTINAYQFDDGAKVEM